MCAITDHVRSRVSVPFRGYVVVIVREAAMKNEEKVSVPFRGYVVVIDLCEMYEELTPSGFRPLSGLCSSNFYDVQYIWRIRD